MFMFTAEQRATLRALVDRIVPPDEFPGGWEAGVGDYLARQLAGDLRAYVEIYRGGLDALDAEARAVGGAPFAALELDAQDSLLARIESGAVATPWPIDAAAFFRDACAHTAEGYYSDPANGGNREGISWRMIGFEVRI
jgi:hypothetical protein